MTFKDYIETGDTAKVKELLTEGVSRFYRYSLVTCAIRNGHNEILKMLLDGFAKTSNDGSLHDPVSSALTVAAENGNIEAVNILLEYGGGNNSWNLCDAVLNAAVGGHYEIVKILVDYNPNMLYHQCM